MKQKKKGLKKRILALSLAGILCFGSVPQNVYASESSDGNAQETTQSDQISEETADELLQQEKNVEEEANISGTAEDTVTGAEDTVTGETGNTEPEIVIPGAVRLKEAATPEDMAEEAKTEVAKHTRLIVVSESDLTECYGAVECIRGYGNLHILTYEDATTCENAYAQFTAAGMSVEYDETVEAYEEETEEAKNMEETLEDTNKETKAEEQEKKSTEKKDEKQEIVVAVIDTGADSSSKILKGRIKDDGYIPDTNGHGTLMAEIIASNTGEEVKILPIQAFDENGKGTVSTTYLAIMEAIEKKADIINLSVSGKGTSPMLASAIRQAKEAGIPVIVSAGNNGADTTDYMPGNITDALTVSAVTENKEAAAYSNHGKEVDFCAIGTVTKDNGTKDTSDDVTYEGTSVSAAYLTAYAAMILKENPQADVEACLKESAEDLGETGWDSLYGYGYVSRENIISNIEKEEKEENEESEEEKKDDSGNMITGEDGEQELEVSADIKNKDFWIYNLGSSVSISIIGIEDSTGEYGGNWNNLGKGGIYYGLYPRGDGGYDLMVTMSCDVTDWTPYIDLTTSKPGYRPTGWTDFYSSNPGMNQEWYDKGQNEVHNLNEMWVHGTDGYFFRLYIGAGFAMDRMTVQWERLSYHINHDMNGATYIDQNHLNYLNSIEYQLNQYYSIPEANNFANKYNRVNYDANGGSCGSVYTGESYDEGYSEFLGWDSNIIGYDSNWNPIYGILSQQGFNDAYYANAHPDVMEAFGYDKLALWNHYCNWGQNAGYAASSGHNLYNLTSMDLYQPGKAFINMNAAANGTTTLTARWKDPLIYLPTPTRTGYTFTGWYIGDTYIGKGWDLYLINGANITLTAHWTPNTYHINHDMNGATYVDQNHLNYLNSVEYRVDQYYSIPDANTFANKYNCVNYDATGGTCISDGTGGSYDEGYSEFLGWDSNIIGYDSDWNPAYGTLSQHGFNDAYYANVHPDVMQAFGYDKLASWSHYYYWGKDAGYATSSGHNLDNLTSMDLYQPGKAFRNMDVVANGTTTLTARWKDPTVKLPTPIRAGYTFTGWYKEDETYVGKGGDSYTVSGTGTLYAHWTPNTYYINYDMNGATSIDENYLNKLNKNKYTYDIYYNVPDANTFAKKYNRVNYDAAGGTCTSNNTEESYEEGYSAFLGWDSNIIGYDSNWNPAYGTLSQHGFNDAYYANDNPDLMETYKYDKLALWVHYYYWGKDEGRSTNSGHNLENLTSMDLYQPGKAFRNMNAAANGKTTLTARWKDPTVKLPTPTREGHTFLGWYKEDETYVGKGGDSYTLSGTSTLHAKWKEHEYTLVFDGNGADIGSMESITVHYTDTLKLPKNLYENTSVPCTFMGWVHDKDALKADYKDEEKLEVKKIIKKAGKEAEDGATITLYAFWDIAPEIEAKDWYIGKEMAENMTEEQLLERAKSTDREDGDLERGKELVVVDFDKEDFLHLGQIGSCTVTYQATDSAGNITYKDIKVEVSEDGWLDMPYYIRFISEEFYGKKPESGGCVDGSVWNEIPEYKQELTDAFARINNDTGVITYVFKRDDIKASHDFTEAHGFGEYEEDGALNLWLDAFAHCKQ